MSIVRLPLSSRRRLRRISAFVISGSILASIAPIWLGATTAGALDPIPTVTPLPTVTVPPVPAPNPPPAPGSGGGSSSPAPSAPSAPSGSSTGGSTSSSGTSGTEAVSSSSTSSQKAAGPRTTLTSKMPRATKLVGEGEGGCDTTPTPALLGQLAREEPAPSFVLSEPPGMNRSQTNNRLLPILRRVHRRSGMTMRQAFLKVAGPFPVAGPASWSDDWHAYRPCPYPHLHQGLDIFAHWGTPLVAVSKGVLTEKGVSSISGLYIQITNRHGFEFFYDHFSRFARGLRVGQ